ncbi:MAG: DUF2798 domain-containing protein [Pseudomonadota bacterium]
MIPARFSHVAFSLILSGVMSFIVTGVATVKALGLIDGVFAMWMENWVFGWSVAFPTVILAAPGVRALVARLTRDKASA